MKLAPSLDRPSSPRSRRRAVLRMAVACLVAPLPGLGVAQARVGRLVVPFPSGGPTDVLARILADGYLRALGTTYVVENKPGATGNIGAADVASAAPDGNTLLVTNTAIVMNPFLFTRTPVVDPFRDLTPVSALGTTAFAVVIPAGAPERTLEEWLVRMRAKPDVFYGSFGIGSTNHLYGHDFAGKTGLKGVHVPYKGDAPVLQDLLGGQLDFAFLAVGSARRMGDKVRVLAVTGEEPSPFFAEAPTLKQRGIAGFEQQGWLGLFAPKGTPAELRRSLAKVTSEILGKPEAREKLEQFGLVVFGTTPERFEEMSRSESVRQAARIKAANASLD